MSGLVFGCAALGLDYGLRRPDGSGPALDDERAEALVRHAHRVGFTAFDTAPAYGSSEARLGRVADLELTLWTKATGDPAKLSSSLDASLERLRRRSVSLLQWHNWTAPLADDAAFRRAWEALGGDPRVERLGATTYGAVDALAAVHSGLFSVVQLEWNALNQAVLDALGSTARERRVEIAVRSVYLQGALTTEGRALPPLPRLHERVSAFRALAAKLGRTPTELALGAALDHPGIDHVLVGIDRPEQADEAMAVAGMRPLDGSERSALRALDLAGAPEVDPRHWAELARTART